jgi:tetratricopeptide (TPR) repeat protein
MSRNIAFLFVCALLFSTIPMMAQSNNEAKKLFNEGNGMLKAGNFEGAIEKYNAALKLEKHEFYYYQRGLALKKARKMDEATASFQAAVETNPKWATGHFALAGAHFSAGAYDKAIAGYERALKENPTHGPSKKGLAAAQTAQAQVQLGQGEIAGAIGLCEKAITNDEKYDKAYVILAQAQNKNGKYDEAIKAATTAIKLIKSPQKGAAYFELGLAYRNQGNTTKAKEAFTNAKKDPTYARSADYELKMLK